VAQLQELALPALEAIEAGAQPHEAYGDLIPDIELSTSSGFRVPTSIRPEGIYTSPLAGATAVSQVTVRFALPSDGTRRISTGDKDHDREVSFKPSGLTPPHGSLFFDVDTTRLFVGGTYEEVDAAERRSSGSPIGVADLAGACMTVILWPPMQDFGVDEEFQSIRAGTVIERLKLYVNGAEYPFREDDVHRIADDDGRKVWFACFAEDEPLRPADAG
jgi:hypothetical protein